MPTTYHIRYDLTDTPLISILIPNKDHGEDLRRCVESIQRLTTYPNWEIVIIENNSVLPHTYALYEDLKQDERIRVVTWEGGFNYSAINNYGATFAKGEVLVLLNNDTYVITPNWLEEMLMFAQREDVGAVGAMLYYPDDTVQHAGVIVGVGGLADHAHRFYPRNSTGYFNRMVVAQNLSCVTAACLMLRRSVWEQLHGLVEGFVVGLNDVDLCLRLREAGLLVVFTPFAELYHDESKSRGTDNTFEKNQRFFAEKGLFHWHWKTFLQKGDPYYSPNLNLEDGKPLFSEKFPMK